MISISKNGLIHNESNVNDCFWIYKINFNRLKEIKNSKILNKSNENKIFNNELSSNDRIILFSTIKVKNVKKICFLAYTMVDSVESKNQTSIIKLKGVKFFNKPVPTVNLKGKLSFTKNLKKSSTAYKNDYKLISEDDFNLILNEVSLTKAYPFYYDENINLSTGDFILKTIKSLYLIISSTSNLKQMEISSFINLLFEVLCDYGVDKSLEEVQEFYARNIWKLNFKHYSSRDSDTFMNLYTKSGKKEVYSYISFE